MSEILYAQADAEFMALSSGARSTSRNPPECALGIPEVCTGLTSSILEMPMKERSPAGDHPIKLSSSCRKAAVRANASNFAQFLPCALP